MRPGLHQSLVLALTANPYYVFPFPCKYSWHEFREDNYKVGGAV
jgi:hypothetical protein